MTTRKSDVESSSINSLRGANQLHRHLNVCIAIFSDSNERITSHFPTVYTELPVSSRTNKIVSTSEVGYGKRNKASNNTSPGQHRGVEAAKSATYNHDGPLPGPNRHSPPSFCRTTRSKADTTGPLFGIRQNWVQTGLYDPNIPSKQTTSVKAKPSDRGRKSKLTPRPRCATERPSTECEAIASLIRLLETRAVSQEALVSDVQDVYERLDTVKSKHSEISTLKSCKMLRISLKSRGKPGLDCTRHDCTSIDFSFIKSLCSELQILTSRHIMPSRMWRYGINYFLELLLHPLPPPFGQMLTFLYLAYLMTALSNETGPAFARTCIDGLGDLGRHRMGFGHFVCISPNPCLLPPRKEDDSTVSDFRTGDSLTKVKDLNPFSNLPELAIKTLKSNPNLSALGDHYMRPLIQEGSTSQVLQYTWTLCAENFRWKQINFLSHMSTMAQLILLRGLPLAHFNAMSPLPGVMLMATGVPASPTGNRDSSVQTRIISRPETQWPWHLAVGVSTLACLSLSWLFNRKREAGIRDYETWFLVAALLHNAEYGYKAFVEERLESSWSAGLAAMFFTSLWTYHDTRRMGTNARQLLALGIATVVLVSDTKISSSMSLTNFAKSFMALLVPCLLGAALFWRAIRTIGGFIVLLN